MTAKYDFKALQRIMTVRPNHRSLPWKRPLPHCPRNTPAIPTFMKIDDEFKADVAMLYGVEVDDLPEVR